MKNTFVKIGSAVLVLAMSVSVICSCNKKGDAAVTGTAAVNPSNPSENVVVDNTLEIEVDNGTFAPIEATGMDTIDVESAWDELCEGMTPEEIASCEADFTEMGLSKEDVIALMYQ